MRKCDICWELEENARRAYLVRGVARELLKQAQRQGRRGPAERLRSEFESASRRALQMKRAVLEHRHAATKSNTLLLNNS
jgi:hypothetical protein